MQEAWFVDLRERRATKFAANGTKIISTDWYEHRFDGGFSLSTFDGWGQDETECARLLDEAVEQIRLAKEQCRRD